MRLKETTHHGGYHEVYEIVLESETQGEFYLECVLGSNYYQNTSPDNPYIANAVEELKTNGRFNFGWTTWEVI